MITTVRIYRDARPLIDALQQRASDIRAAIQNADGFVSYQLVRTANGCFSVTTTRDAASAEAVTLIASEFIRENLPNLTTIRPEILGGETVLELDRSPTAV